MKCRSVNLGHGVTMIVCGGPRHLRKKCKTPNCGREAQYQCDFKVGANKTCDRLMCEAHRTQGRDGDLCEPHAKLRKMANG